jgi:hypothetical protein
MVHPGLSTINTGKNKKKPTVAQLRAKAEHEAWQRKNGVHPDQLSVKLSKKIVKKLQPYLQIDDKSEKVSNGFAFGGAKKSIFDSQWQRTYNDDPAMAEREEEALKAAESLKRNLIPLYNKGPIQLKPRGLNMTELGKRR